MQYRTKTWDLQGRWKAGDVGTAVEHLSKKYDFLIDFGPLDLHPGPTAAPIIPKTVRRQYFFFADEVELVGPKV